MDIEAQRQPVKVGVGQVLQQRMLVEVVAIMKDQDAEIGGVSKDAADFEAVGGGRVQRGGCSERVEPAQV